MLERKKDIWDAGPDSHRRGMLSFLCVFYYAPSSLAESNRRPEMDESVRSPFTKGISSTLSQNNGAPLGMNGKPVMI